MAKEKKEPVAFLSYVHDDDTHDDGRIITFCQRLSAEIRMQTGDQFPIFLDRKDLKWGQNWKKRIDGSLGQVTFLIPIITPGYFKSEPCRNELEKFVASHEDERILPLYYVSTSEMNDPEEREKDDLAQILYNSQYIDWRELRFKPFADPVMGQAISNLALQIKDILERLQDGIKNSKSNQKEKIPTTVTIKQADKKVISSESLTPDTKQNSPQRTEILTIVVDAMHRGNYSSINEAIKAASPGTRILIKPGLYNESLIIDKPLEIIGDGDREQIVVQVKDSHVINFVTSMGKISNLTLKQLGGDFYAVNIAQGRLDIENCDITGAGLSIIGIYNWADPRIRRNIIHGGKYGGISIYANGQGTIEDNDISNNLSAGIAIGNGSNPIIQKNRIGSGNQCGIHIYEAGQGTIEDNEIFANEFSGIQIKKGGNPSIRKNRIRDGKYCGIAVFDNGLGVIEDNVIVNNTTVGIEVTSGGDPVVRKNRINKNAYQGIWIKDQGKGKYEENDLTNNSRGPWSISEDSKDLISRKNNIEK